MPLQMLKSEKYKHMSKTKMREDNCFILGTFGNGVGRKELTFGGNFICHSFVLVFCKKCDIAVT